MRTHLYNFPFIINLKFLLDIVPTQQCLFLINKIEWQIIIYVRIKSERRMGFKTSLIRDVNPSYWFLTNVLIMKGMIKIGETI